MLGERGRGEVCDGSGKEAARAGGGGGAGLLSRGPRRREPLCLVCPTLHSARHMVGV